MDETPDVEVINTDDDGKTDLRIGQVFLGWGEYPRCYDPSHSGGSELAWCEHIKAAIQTHLDAQQFWPDNTAVQLNKSWHMTIPIVPTKKLYSKIILETVSPFAYSVRLGMGGAYLGMLALGEGRRMLRTMVLDWFSRYDYAALTCGSPSHGMAANRALQNAKETPTQLRSIATLWSVFETSVCLACRERIAGVGSDDSDLIPEDEVSTKSVWKREDIIKPTLSTTDFTSGGGIIETDMLRRRKLSEYVTDKNPWEGR